MNVYYKKDAHKEDTERILEAFQLRKIQDDKEIGTLAYVVAATYKTDAFLKCIDVGGRISLEGVERLIAVASSSEKAMIRFALQCFNSHYSDIPLSEVFYSLDLNNERVIKQAINIRY